MEHKNEKMMRNIGIFTLVMVFTFWSVFRNQNMVQIIGAVRKLTIFSFIGAGVLAVLFVAAEGCMIFYLLKEIGEKITLVKCISYSFIGFFFSGLTPSATGGQPMQLYYMKKDGIKMASSSVVLMTVAIVYKFVLVILGALIYLFWRKPLRDYLKGYYGLYFLGWFLNVLLVVILIFVMLRPEIIRRILCWGDALLIRFQLWKPSEIRKNKIEEFLQGYQDTVAFLQNRKRSILYVVLGTFLQRGFAFALTYVVYAGLGLKGVSFFSVITLLQASICISVDMLPIPGAQGITELMYQNVFGSIFGGKYLMASMCITRGISFYLIMVVSLVVWGIRFREES